MSDTDQKEIETLRRMLAPPPTLHKPLGEKRTGKRDASMDRKEAD